MANERAAGRVGVRAAAVGAHARGLGRLFGPHDAYPNTAIVGASRLIGVILLASFALSCGSSAEPTAGPGAFAARVNLMASSGARSAVDSAAAARSAGLRSALSANAVGDSAARHSATPSSGCSHNSAAVERSSEASVQQLRSGGIDREYRVYIPAAVSNPAPLVLNLHGRSGSGEFQERYSGFIPVAEREGFVLISPEGTGAMRAWSAGATGPSTIDDVAFLTALIDKASADLCLDSSRIYVAGMSNGAFMASLAACRIVQISAVAMVAGADLPTQCAHAAAALAVHGTEDKLVPYLGGKIRGSWQYGGVVNAVSGWAGVNGCDSGPLSDLISDHVTRTQFKNCRARTELITIDGGGHTWPGAQPYPDLGLTSSEMNAAEEIWRFFMASR